MPERIVKGPPLTVAVPLLNAAPPRFVTVKLSCALAPTATVPKLRLAGDTANCAGVKPTPVTVLVLLPPLLVNTTTLLKLAALAGAKLIATNPVWPGARLKELPLWMAKPPPPGMAALPERGRPPLLTTWKFCVLVCPRMIAPKARLLGLRVNCGGRLVTTM